MQNGESQHWLPPEGGDPGTPPSGGRPILRVNDDCEKKPDATIGNLPVKQQDALEAVAEPRGRLGKE
jgi:hypothetical protein